MALRAVPEHPKFARLKRALSLSKFEALGLLETLWHFTGKFAPRGNVGRFSDAEIEDWVEWPRETGTLIEALLQTGWLDRSAEHRLVVHDWNEHADQTTKKQLGRTKQGFVQDVSGHIPAVVSDIGNRDGLLSLCLSLCLSRCMSQHLNPHLHQAIRERRSVMDQEEELELLPREKDAVSKKEPTEPLDAKSHELLRKLMKNMQYTYQHREVPDETIAAWRILWIRLVKRHGMDLFREALATCCELRLYMPIPAEIEAQIQVILAARAEAQATAKKSLKYRPCGECNDCMNEEQKVCPDGQVYLYVTDSGNPAIRRSKAKCYEAWRAIHAV